MKLNKEQIKALANKILAEIKEQVNLKNEKITNLKENRKKIDKIMSTFEPAFELQESNIINISFYNYKDEKIYAYTKESLREKLEKGELDLIQMPSSFDIENAIILNTIECDNLDQLIERIKNEYIN
jgi:hypothetical protein